MTTLTVLCLKLIVENEVQWVWKVESETAEIAGCRTDNPLKTTTKLDMYINKNYIYIYFKGRRAKKKKRNPRGEEEASARQSEMAGEESGIVSRKIDTRLRRQGTFIVT